MRRLRVMLRWLRRKDRTWDRGTVAVTFLLSLPILLFIIAIFVQYALIVNAQLVIDRAVQAAARTAMTALPTNPDVDNVQGDLLVRRSAYLALAHISPMAADESADGQMIADALAKLAPVTDLGLGRRYTYAENGATVEWQRVDDGGNVIGGVEWTPTDYARSHGQRVKVTVHYPFLLTVPAVNKLIGENSATPGVTGRVLMLQASTIVQLSHGREAQASGSGWAQ